MPVVVKIQCKQCSRSADAHTFILDPVYKKMVCPQCVNERKTKAMLDMRKAKSPQQPVQPTQQRVDPEDVELERLARQKKEQVKERPKLEIIDAERAKVTCNKCSYKFTYNRVTQNPKYCPYCGKAIELK